MSNSHTGKSSDEKNYDAKIGIFSDKWRMPVEFRQGQVATDAELQCLKVARLLLDVCGSRRPKSAHRHYPLASGILITALAAMHPFAGLSLPHFLQFTCPAEVPLEGLCGCFGVQVRLFGLTCPGGSPPRRAKRTSPGQVNCRNSRRQ